MKELLQPRSLRGLVLEKELIESLGATSNNLAKELPRGSYKEREETGTRFGGYTCIFGRKRSAQRS